VKVQQKQALSRQEAARFIAELAEGLGEDGKVTVRLGSSTLELSVADQVDWELEVEVDGDKIELELELKWSRSGRVSAEVAEGSGEDEFEEDQSEDDAIEADGSLDGESAQEAPAEVEAEDRVLDEDVAGSGEVEPVQAASLDRSAKSGRGRRRAAAAAGKSDSNGVDTAAVRAWAAANGLTVSPRGRIKEKVIKAYRDAGN
jgi:amphi-Trp domain-containing protein